MWTILCVTIFIVSLAEAESARTDVSVSGISSGGAMAAQLHLAYSSVFSGSGIVAGPPYYCGQGNTFTAASQCMSGPAALIPVSKLKSQLQSYVSAGSADPTSNLQNDPVYIFSGKNDRTVVPDVVKIHEQIYSSVGAHIKTNYNLPDNHGFATDNYGGRCESLNMEFINNCNFNLAYDILNHIFGGNLIKPSISNPTVLAGQLITIEQSALMNPETVTTTDSTSTNIFSHWAKWLKTSMAVYQPLFGLTLPGMFGTSSIGASGFDKEGFVYYPANCINGKKCPIHVALHGCLQGKSKIGDVFAKKAGYLEVAELNDIIIFFPQVVASFFNPTNPQGCWDWMGYSSPNYANKLGPQMEGVKKMVDSIKAINAALAA